MQPSFEALYRGHFGLVWSMVARAGVAPGAREDAVQEVWLTVHRKLHSYDGSASAASWIAGIARHVAWRQIRAVVRARRKLAAFDRDAPAALDDPMLARDRMRGIEDVIAGLEPMFRDVFVAVEILGATGPEAAAQLGLPLNTLYSRLRLARARVQTGLDALEQDPIGEAPRGLAERTWLAIAPSLGSTAAPAGMASFAGALAAVVVGAVTAIAWGTSPAQPSIATIERAAIVATPQDMPAPMVAAIPTIAGAHDDAIAVASPDAKPTAPSVPRRVASRDEADAPRDTVEAEASLLAHALEVLRAGDGAAALDVLAEHERRFPTGAFAIDRRVARVRALCLTGKVAQARGEATVLRITHADRPAVAALGDGCAEPS